MLGLCNFNRAFSVGGEGFVWTRYFILCFFMIKFHCCSVFVRIFYTCLEDLWKAKGIF